MSTLQALTAVAKTVLSLIESIQTKNSRIDSGEVCVNDNLKVGIETDADGNVTGTITGIEPKDWKDIEILAREMQEKQDG